MKMGNELSCSRLGALVVFAFTAGTFPPGTLAPTLNTPCREVPDTAATSKKGKSKIQMFSFFTEGFNHLRDKVMLRY